MSSNRSTYQPPLATSSAKVSSFSDDSVIDPKDYLSVIKQHVANSIYRIKDWKDAAADEQKIFEQSMCHNSRTYIESLFSINSYKTSTVFCDTLLSSQSEFYQRVFGISQNKNEHLLITIREQGGDHSYTIEKRIFNGRTWYRIYQANAFSYTMADWLGIDTWPTVSPFPASSDLVARFGNGRKLNEEELQSFFQLRQYKKFEGQLKLEVSTCNVLALKPAQSAIHPSNALSHSVNTNLNHLLGSPTELITLYGKNVPERTLTPKQVGEMFGFTFMHGIQKANGNICEPLLHLDEKNSAFNAQQSAVIRYLKNPINYLNLMFVDATCGYSTIARKDIPANTLIGIYSGYSGYSTIDTEYALGTNNYSDIDAKKFGDLTRFMPHLPDRLGGTQSATWIKPFDGRTIALQYHDQRNQVDIDYANVELQPVKFQNNITCYAFWTTCDIKHGEFVGWDYGIRYWMDNKYQIYLKPESCLNTAIRQIAERQLTKDYRHVFKVTTKKLELIGKGIQPLAGNPCILYQPKKPQVIERDFKVDNGLNLDMKYFFNKEGMATRLNMKR